MGGENGKREGEREIENKYAVNQTCPPNGRQINEKQHDQKRYGINYSKAKKQTKQKQKQKSK